VRGDQGELCSAPPAVGLPPPPAKISALPKTWPGLHCRAVVLFVFCYQNIVTVIVNVVHTPSLHHRQSLWCKVGTKYYLYIHLCTLLLSCSHHDSKFYDSLMVHMFDPFVQGGVLKLWAPCSQQSL